MSEIHVSQKLAIPYQDLEGNDHCRLSLFSGMFTTYEGLIRPGDVNVSDCGNVVVDERIPILGPG